MRNALFIDDLGAVEPIPTEATNVFSGTIYSVWQWEQKLFDGSFTTWEGLKRADTAHTVGVLPDGRILLTEDAQPGRGSVLTPPGGQVDPGETPEETAKREFVEETGYEIGTLVPWHYYRASTKMDWYIYAFVGRDLKKVGEPASNEGERATVKTFSFEELLQLGRTSEDRVVLRDRILRILLLEALVDPAKKEELRKILYA